MSAIVRVGTPIAVVAPSHAYDPRKLQAGLDIARAYGHELHLLPDTLQPHRYFAATDAHRRDQLITALSSADFGAVWLVRGGSGLTRLIDHLPWADLPPRPVIGFSDATALLLPLWDRVGSQTVHGPVLHSLANTSTKDVDHLFRLLAGEPTPALPGRALVPGQARGALTGGNLCLLAALCGTPFQPSARGRILVLEEIGEAPYRLDRTLIQLRSAGVFDGVAGVAVGELTDCAPPPASPWSLDDLLLDVLGPLGVPVVVDLPIGHGRRNAAFPIGRAAMLSERGLSWHTSSAV